MTRVLHIFQLAKNLKHHKQKNISTVHHESTRQRQHWMSNHPTSEATTTGAIKQEINCKNLGGDARGDEVLGVLGLLLEDL